jgi:hypothetical protein
MVADLIEREAEVKLSEKPQVMFGKAAQGFFQAAYQVRFGDCARVGRTIVAHVSP